MTKEMEALMMSMKEKCMNLSPEKKEACEKQMKKRNFIDYKKIETSKSELLRLEARRAQLELFGDEKKLELLEKKIHAKKEKLRSYCHRESNE